VPKPPTLRYNPVMLDLLREYAAFLLVSVVLGGGAAWLAGRAIAQTWRPWWQAILYMLVLGGAVRFIHFALFDGMLTEPAGYVRDTLVTIAFAAAGFRVMRRGQMARQYGFLRAATAAPSSQHGARSDSGATA
jgi:hypothetical protein